MTGTDGHGVTVARDDGIAVERELLCKLTEEDLLRRGEDMSACELTIEVLKAKRRELNGKISKQSTERAKLAHVIESGEEPRLVLCKWISNFATNQLILVRQDTGAEVEAKAMTARERQDTLDFGIEPAAVVHVDEVDEDGVITVHVGEAIEAKLSELGAIEPLPKQRTRKKKTATTTVKFASVREVVQSLTAATATLKKNRAPGGKRPPPPTKKTARKTSKANGRTQTARA